MMGLLNIGSLVLGLIAWILPAANLMRNNRENQGNRLIIGLVSMSACVISLLFQIIYNYHLVKIEDWSALMDTTRGVMVAATVLILVTIILNAINLTVYRKRSER
ncbi:hypothetical protein [Niallia circulans]|uniref:hypothetical protein n=1 Tax=Niallia circulans TaxID=1397 RepID=UPI001F20A2A0|nr:hypothetical protein [Niallia circulans]MCF2649985.1 hypothetical protein [Niallia circulans]